MGVGQNGMTNNGTPWDGIQVSREEIRGGIGEKKLGKKGCLRFKGYFVHFFSKLESVFDNFI